MSRTYNPQGFVSLKHLLVAPESDAYRYMMRTDRKVQVAILALCIALMGWACWYAGHTIDANELGYTMQGASNE